MKLNTYFRDEIPTQIYDTSDMEIPSDFKQKSMEMRGRPAQCLSLVHLSSSVAHITLPSFYKASELSARNELSPKIFISYSILFKIFLNLDSGVSNEASLFKPIVIKLLTKFLSLTCMIVKLEPEPSVISLEVFGLSILVVTGFPFSIVLIINSFSSGFPYTIF